MSAVPVGGNGGVGCETRDEKMEHFSGVSGERMELETTQSCFQRREEAPSL